MCNECWFSRKKSAIRTKTKNCKSINQNVRNKSFCVLIISRGEIANFPLSVDFKRIINKLETVNRTYKMGTVVGTCMPETEHHQTTTHLSTLAPIRRRRYGNVIQLTRISLGYLALDNRCLFLSFSLRFSFSIFVTMARVRLDNRS